MKARLTPQAEDDLEEIGDRIALRNPARAVSFVRELRERAKRIAEFPNAGPPRPLWGEGIRIAIHGKYLIVYRVRDETAGAAHRARRPRSRCVVREGTSSGVTRRRSYAGLRRRWSRTEVGAVALLHALERGGAAEHGGNAAGYLDAVLALDRQGA